MIISYFPSQCNTPGEPFTEFKHWGGATDNSEAVTDQQLIYLLFRI